MAKQLGIKKSIIRQWETEFGLKATEAAPEQNRYYSSDDMNLLMTIKDLIRTKGLSISDAKAHLQTLPAVKYVEPQKEESKIEIKKEEAETETDRRNRNGNRNRSETVNECTSSATSLPEGTRRFMASPLQFPCTSM